jgi:6-phosphofructokinase
MNIDSLRQLFDQPLQGYDNHEAYAVSGPSNVVRNELNYTSLFVANNNVECGDSVRIGIVFSGGPASGGHDVICGILSHLRPTDQLIGFCGGPGGLLRGITKVISPSDIDNIRETGGFDFLGTDRTKIATSDQFDLVRDQVRLHELSALIIVGGDDSNTNALYLADALYGECLVIGVPKTIDGDLRKMPYLPITFGFHSATQHYSYLVEQLNIDSNATKKYWHIIKLMGRSASHVP